MRKKVNALSDLSHESLITMNGLHKVDQANVTLGGKHICDFLQRLFGVKVDLISTIAMSMI